VPILDTMKPTRDTLPRECGIDIVDRRKFDEVMERHGRRFTRRIFSPQELANLRRQNDRAVFPLGFAFKEAVWKALPETAQRKHSFRDIRILWKNRRPRLFIARYRGRFVLDWTVTRRFVIAVAVRFGER